MLIRELVTEFLADRRARKCDPVTVAWYARMLAPFVVRFGEREAGTLTRGDIAAYLTDSERLRSGRTASGSTQHHLANVVSVLQAWALDEEEIERPWMRRIPKPPVGMRTRLPRDAELLAILSRRPRRPDFVRMVKALLLCGARPEELCRARVEDIRADGGARWIELSKHKTGRKTGRVRIIPIGGKFGDILDRAKARRTSGPIFLRRDGKPWTREGLSALFRRRRDRAGVSREVVLYLTRHVAGTRITMTSGVEQAARNLGHAPGSRETARYVMLAPGYLAQCQDAEVPGGGAQVSGELDRR